MYATDEDSKCQKLAFFIGSPLFRRRAGSKLYDMHNNLTVHFTLT